MTDVDGKEIAMAGATNALTGGAGSLAKSVKTGVSIADVINDGNKAADKIKDASSVVKLSDNAADLGKAKKDIHRIGGGGVDNLKLKEAEKKLNPPGISVLKTDSPAEAAQQMRDAFPNATGLHEASKTVGSSSIEKIKEAGFDVIPDPTKKFPNHHRLTHPEGVKGFENEENLKKLSNVFTNTTGN